MKICLFKIDLLLLRILILTITDVVENSTWQEEMNRDFERVFPIAFIYERDTERSKQISRQLKKYYFDDKNITPALVTPLAQVILPLNLFIMWCTMYILFLVVF